MPEIAPTRRVVRIGIFDLDLSARQLRKNGIRVKLQDQPFEILALLVHRPGEVVTREELRQKLWAAGTFVDFDQSLNAAIKRLRDALDDSAESPRFIETLPRQGYRFIAPVERPEGVYKPLTGLRNRVRYIRGRAGFGGIACGVGGVQCGGVASPVARPAECRTY